VATPALVAAKTQCRWGSGAIEIVVDPSLDAVQGHGSEAVQEALAAWESSPAELPSVALSVRPVGEVGYFLGEHNENTVRYAPKGHPLTQGALAVTVVTKNVKQGIILDADLIVNGDYHFRLLDADDEPGAHGPIVYDLQNTLTHELGHVFGLGEDYEHAYATMYAFTQPRETCKRVLSASDIAGISDMYGASDDADTGGGCGGASVSGKDGGGGAWLAIVALAAGMALVRRHRYRLTLLTAAGALVIALPAVGSARVAELRAEVTDVAAHWDRGLIVSEVSWRAETCNGDAELCARTSGQVLGGRIGDIVQVVGHAPAPERGQSVRVQLRTRANGTTVELAPLDPTTGE
jgi:hypothetical protein